MVRAVVVNAAQLATYSQAKQFLLTTGLTVFQLFRFFAVFLLIPDGQTKIEVSVMAWSKPNNVNLLSLS